MPWKVLPPQLKPPSAPFFFAEFGDDNVRVKGRPRCFFGHRIQTSRAKNEGIFAEWIWDGKRLTARNDRFGFCPIFLYHKENQIGISQSVATLIGQGADASLDYPALAVALRMGQFVGEDTAFKYIRALPPSAGVVWEAGRLQLSGGYEFPSVNRNIDRMEAAHTYLELFHKGIQRRLPVDEDIAVPLTGGRDSRHILFELVRSGIRPKFCVTVKMYPADVTTAALVCETLQLDHLVVEQPSNPFNAEVEKNWLTNLGVDEGSYPLALREALVQRGVSTIYDGIGGDMLSAGLFLDRSVCDLFARGRTNDIAKQILSPEEEAIIGRILPSQLSNKCSFDLAIERIATELERHIRAHNPVTSFYFWNRTRRKIALIPYALLSAVPNVFAPYLDHDLFDFLFSLPAELFMDHSFHTETINLGFPQWAHIPFEDKAMKDYDFSSLYAQFARTFSRHLLFRCSPKFVQTKSLYACCFRSLTSASFAASSQWYFRRATWLQQLGVLAEHRRDVGY